MEASQLKSTENNHTQTSTHSLTLTMHWNISCQSSEPCSIELKRSHKDGSEGQGTQMPQERTLVLWIPQLGLRQGNQHFKWKSNKQAEKHCHSKCDWSIRESKKRFFPSHIVFWCILNLTLPDRGWFYIYIAPYLSGWAASCSLGKAETTRFIHLLVNFTFK